MNLNSAAMKVGTAMLAAVVVFGVDSFRRAEGGRLMIGAKCQSGTKCSDCRSGIFKVGVDGNGNDIIKCIATKSSSTTGNAKVCV